MSRWQRPGGSSTRGQSLRPSSATAARMPDWPCPAAKEERYSPSACGSPGWLSPGRGVDRDDTPPWRPLSCVGRSRSIPRMGHAFGFATAFVRRLIGLIRTASTSTADVLAPGAPKGGFLTSAGYGNRVYPASEIIDFTRFSHVLTHDP